jgi:uncharacterized protein YdaU (DUF1376 family)
MTAEKPLVVLPLYARDWLTGTRLMTPSERGIYMDLLCYQWELGALPADPEDLALLIGCRLEEFKRAWLKVAPKFQTVDGQLSNVRLESERRKAEAQRARRRAGAEETNRKRWASESLSDAPSDSLSDAPSESPSVSPPTPTPTPTPTSSDSPKNLSRTGARYAALPLHTAIVALYHELLPAMPKVKVWTDRRRKSLDARIRERVSEGKPADQPQYWRGFFEQVAASEFLTGRTGTWQADLEWLIRPENFAKVIEGRYANRSTTSEGVAHVG